MINRMINYFAFLILTLLWLAFAVGVLFQPEMLTAAWQSFLGWPLISKLTAGLLALPVVIGLWAWESSWPLWLRLILVVGLAWATLYTFLPKKSQPGWKAAAPL